MFGIIYCAYNKINNKRYIGQTIHSLEKRIRHHYSKYSSCVYFHRALKKYKENDWIWKIIDHANSQEELDEKEIFWISFFKTQNLQHGYNLTAGGQGSRDVKVSKEKKLLTRETMLKRVRNNYSKTKQPVSKPVKNLITGECFLSISEAKKETGDNSIQYKLRNKKEWTYLQGEEMLLYCPNAIYCVELNKIYENVRQARLEDRFHQGNLGKALSSGEPREPKEYAGYTFYWLNPEYHIVE